MPDRGDTSAAGTAWHEVLRASLSMLPLAVALVLEALLWAYIDPFVWLLLYPAVFLCSWIGGLRAGIVASAIATVFAVWLFVPSPAWATPSRHYGAAVVFFTTGVCFGVFHDRLRNTNRRVSRALAALQQATRERRIFEALLENSTDFIGIADPSGKPIYVNPGGRQMVGLPADYPIENTKIPDYYAADQRAFATDVIVKAMIEHGRWHGQTAFRNWQTEAPIPVSDTHFMIRDPMTGEVLGMATITRDISEVTRARQETEAARRDLDRAQSVAKVGSWRLDARTNELVWSAELYRIFEIAPGTLLTYEVFLSLVHPDDRTYVDREWKAAMQGAPYDIEHRIVVNGMTKWVREKADLEFDENHVLIGGIGITHDITERKAAEEELRLAEAKASGIVSIAADAIISIDADQRITLFNEGAEAIFGHTKAEAIGASLDVLIPERLREKHREHVRRFAAEQSTSRRVGHRGVSIVGLRKNGEEFPADATISKLDIDGTQIMTVALRDITEQQRYDAEQKLLVELGTVLASTLELDVMMTRIQQLMTRELADACAVGILDEQRELSRVDAMSRDPAHAESCNALVRHPLLRERALWSELEAHRTVVIGDIAPDRVAAVARSNADLRALHQLDPRSVIVAPLFTQRGLLGAMALIASAARRSYAPADAWLAERIAQRAALAIDNAQLYAAARRAIGTRDEVLGIVAHDLRNPLGSILMQAEMLRRPEGPDRRSHRPGEMIERSARRMNRLIQDLLDVTRIDEGRLSLEPARLSPSRTVADAVQAQQQLAAAASLELREADVPADLPDVWADHHRLLQIFENLIGNAVKFTEAGGTIAVGARQRRNEVLFWVADTGKGIAADQLPHVFDRFWQATTHHRGAGLGLAIVKGLVEAHGGRIWAESALGQGSTFFFTIPIAAEPLTAAASPA